MANKHKEKLFYKLSSFLKENKLSSFNMVDLYKIESIKNYYFNNKDNIDNDTNLKEKDILNSFLFHYINIKERVEYYIVTSPGDNFRILITNSNYNFNKYLSDSKKEEIEKSIVFFEDDMLTFQEESYENIRIIYDFEKELLTNNFLLKTFLSKIPYYFISKYKKGIILTLCHLLNPEIS